MKTMKEILFRAKTLDENKWVEGCYVKQYDAHILYLCEQDEYGFDCRHIVPDTLGQYIGLTDNNGTRVFEGDIVKCWGGESFGGYYEYTKTILIEEINDYDILGLLYNSENILVIGNIYDNPDLLKEIKV